MPTRKQRRRRQKDLRHQYEFVYVDEEGREVEVEPSDKPEPPARRNGKRETAKPRAKARGARPIREVQPPSWQRVTKRALLFGPLIFIAFTAINRGQPLAGRLGIAAVYTAFFVPFMYLMDRAMYRSYLKRSGQQLPQRAGKKR